MKVNPENLINLKADLADAGYCSIIEADKLEYHKAIAFQTRILNDKIAKARSQQMNQG